MSRIGVEFEERWWTVVVARTAPTSLIPVWLEREDRRRLLCQVSNNKRFGWSVVVNGKVDGRRLVEGFKSRWQAIQYAINIRVDVNETYRKAMAKLSAELNNE